MFFWTGFENVFLGNVFENVFWEGLENFFWEWHFFWLIKFYNWFSLLSLLR